MKLFIKLEHFLFGVFSFFFDKHLLLYFRVKLYYLNKFFYHLFILFMSCIVLFYLCYFLNNILLYKFLFFFEEENLLYKKFYHLNHFLNDNFYMNPNNQLDQPNGNQIDYGNPQIFLPDLDNNDPENPRLRFRLRPRFNNYNRRFLWELLGEFLSYFQPRPRQ